MHPLALQHSFQACTRLSWSQYPLLPLLSNTAPWLALDAHTNFHRCIWGYCYLFRSSCEFSGLVSHVTSRSGENKVKNQTLLYITRAGCVTHHCSDTDGVRATAHLFRWGRRSSCGPGTNQMILTTGKYLWAEKSNSGSTWECRERKWCLLQQTTYNTEELTVLGIQLFQHFKRYFKQMVWTDSVTLVSFLCPPARSFITTMFGLATFSMRLTCYQ